MVHYSDKSDVKIDLMSADPLRKYEETGEVFLIKPDYLFEKQLMGRVITT